jgi:hypothetical protein
LGGNQLKSLKANNYSKEFSSTCLSSKPFYKARTLRGGELFLPSYMDTSHIDFFSHVLKLKIKVTPSESCYVPSNMFYGLNVLSNIGKSVFLINI